jgi:hypothetical protein
MASYRLTTRHGSHVLRETFDDLEEAIAALQAGAEEVKAAGPLDTVKAFREYEPGRRVAGRIEISSGGWLRGREAGVDVMGDGELVAYAGSIRKRRLEARGGKTIFDAIRREMQ